jgi:hypothetical protein
MPPHPPAARALAHRLLTRAGPPTTPNDDRCRADPIASADASVVAAERACRDVADEITRWFGAVGYHALLTRAVAEAVAEHPVLRSVRIGAPSAPSLGGVADAARAHGAGAVTDAIAAVLTALIALLGRLIGEDLAVNLISQVMTDAARGSTTQRDSDMDDLARAGQAP